jgi:hypothetical protein
MKIIKQTIILSLFLLFIQSCKKDDSSINPTTNYFKIGTNIYPLANASYAVDSANGFTALLITSPGLIYNLSNNNATGSGDYIEFDISLINPVLGSGTYYSPNGFEAFIGLNCSATNNYIGNEYDQDYTLPGTLTISKSNSTYTLNFQYTLGNGQLVTGQYIGPITKMF